MNSMNFPLKTYKSTEFICNIYDISKDFLFNRIKSGILLQNVHFIKQARVYRWDVKAIQKWWENTENSSEIVDVGSMASNKAKIALNKLLN